MRTKTILILLFSISFVIGQTYIIPDLQRDDFKDLKSWWSINIWGTDHTFAVPNGYFLANFSNPLNGGPGGHLLSDSQGLENIGFSTAYTMMVYGKDDTMDERIRIKYLTPLLPGSRGAGFWHSESVPITINQETWFMEQKADDSYDWAAGEDWWLGRITRGISTEIKETPPFSNQEWHYYRVLRQGREFYELYVDDDPVPLIHAEPADLGGILNEDYGFNCWNDNLVYHHTQNVSSGNDTIEVYYNGWIGTCSFIVDFVEIRKGLYNPSYAVAPGNVIRLRQVPDEIDNGVSDGLWKGPYSFTVSSGPVVILSTAKAEELDGYGDDDDLKMVLDDKDFGYNTARSWDGDTDQGSPKTITIDTTLSPGEHTLKFYSEATPILYDATVLNAPNGAVALNEDLYETAPTEENDYLWKTFNFSCDSGWVAVYISGSADEEPGWNYRNNPDPDGVFPDIDSTDDDELRIVLDDINYGWGSDSSFLGDRLFGDSKTILINQNVSAGTHFLKLYASYTPTVYKVLVYVENAESGSGISEKKLPEKFSLQQNYPNPFNPRTAIPVILNKKEKIRLDIFNINGKRIRRLVDGEYGQGKHTFVWEGKDAAGRPVASGIYIYRLKTDAQVLTKKMTLLK